MSENYIKKKYKIKGSTKGAGLYPKDKGSQSTATCVPSITREKPNTNYVTISLPLTKSLSHSVNNQVAFPTSLSICTNTTQIHFTFS